jgi:hypothetical protein
MNLHVVCIGSYQSRDPKVCDCFVFLVVAEDKTKAQVKGRQMCEERYSYLKGWDEAGGLDVITLEQGMQVGQYSLSYSIMENSIGLNNININHVVPAVYATGVASHYWWGQDEYPECLLSLTVAADDLEAKRFGEQTKEKLFALVDGDWVDSYAVATLKLDDVNQVEKYHIQWSIQNMEN